MKTSIRNISLAGLFIGTVSVISCQRSALSIPLVQPQPKRTKNVTVSIKDVKPIYSASATTSFSVGPMSKPTVVVHWNGYGFLCKDDSGKTFWQYSNDLAFRGRQSARFIIRKKVMLTDKNGSTTVSSSQTVTVKRGIPTTF